jgi:hypothetical protein
VFHFSEFGAVFRYKALLYRQIVSSKSAFHGPMSVGVK